ncbi:MAG: OmpH family outer membrane protein [Chloroflexota bacterium]
MFRKSIILIAIILFATSGALAQKVGFISSNVIREKFSESQQADQRIQSFVEDWKREIASYQKQIEDLEFEIKKNRLVWSDAEKIQKDKDLANLRSNLDSYAKQKFEQGGEYDLTVSQIRKPVEQKIYAAVQEVASDQGYDIIIDQSVQPLPYVNFKYDLTLRVLKALGVNVEELEKEQQEKIDKDPRNAKKESKTPRRASSRRRGATATEPEEEKPTEEREFEQPSENGKRPPAVMTPEDLRMRRDTTNTKPPGSF